MAISTTGPTELFNLLQPRFRQITFEVAAFTPLSKPGRIYLVPRNEAACYISGFHSLSINPDSDFVVHFIYNKASKQELGLQMADTVLKAVLAGPFAGRKFYADPGSGAIERACRMYAQDGSFGNIPIVFSYEGEPIPGLRLMDNMLAYTPFFFLPGDTPEARAVAAALELEQARLRESKRVRRGEKSSSLEFLRDGLSSALAAVSA